MITPSPRKLFINLPVKDLKRAVDFFTKLGFRFNPQFTDESATCMIVSEEAYFMLLVEGRFREFTSKPIADAHATTEALFGISASSRAEVDALVETAIANGGSPINPPVDHGFMYLRTFRDPDGHHWEVFYMDPAAIQPQA